ncbi:hypothetical protein AQUCO_00100895v1 [Aquilegia coerulea]|uniref:Uncharacterized protein n=1 Tax=Aquilegia coerulea TaxID=218851 RepID=A0A2G5FCH7_AQUCA|nr:hypothetical protein AQUCO_00100895v1 [Aquilegia coerulea]
MAHFTLSSSFFSLPLSLSLHLLCIFSPISKVLFFVLYQEFGYDFSINFSILSPIVCEVFFLTMKSCLLDYGSLAQMA